MKTEYQRPELSRFAELAEAFCHLLTNHEYSAAEQLAEVHLLLPHLYASALGLPSRSVLVSEKKGEDEESEDADDRDTVWRAEVPKSAAIAPPNFSRLREFLGHRTDYRQIFDPHDWSESEEVVGNVLDDLFDIYWDLSRGLYFWHEGATGKAIWVWRCGFENHWGEHATGTLRALYALSAWHDMAWPGGSAARNCT